MTVKIVTDSTCDLPRDLVEQLEITVVPLTVFFGDEALLDGVDIGADEFYERQARSAVLPRTSQPSVDLFRVAYQELGEETNEVVSIHLSSKMSGTLNAASVAREVVAHSVHVDLIDSYNVGLGLGLIVLEAAAAAKAGAPLADVVAVARRAMDHVSVHLAVDTLEFLQRGGRIGRARSLLGSVLSIKPILKVEDGEVAPFERVRTRGKAVERIFEIASNLPRSKAMFIAASGDPTTAREMVERLKPLLPHTDIRVGQLGPAVGVYAGPGALGVAALARE